MATAREEQKAPAEITPERFSEITLAIEAELSRFMVGQADLIRLTLIALIGGGHVLLEGVPGLGKTVLVRSLASVRSTLIRTSGVLVTCCSRTSTTPGSFRTSDRICRAISSFFATFP